MMSMMESMFGMMSMMGNHADRVVGQWPEGEEWVVDTAAVTDLPAPWEFETAVKHPAYDDGSMIIVQQYETKEQAQAGHDGWVKTMDADELPESLSDISDCIFAKLGGCNVLHERK